MKEASTRRFSSPVGFKLSRSIFKRNSYCGWRAQKVDCRAVIGDKTKKLDLAVLWPESAYRTWKSVLPYGGYVCSFVMYQLGICQHSSLTKAT